MRLEIPDFDGLSHMPFAYGGKSCRKEILVLDGEEWMVKFRTKNLPDQKIARDLSSYTNSVISEWLGSHVYEAIGIPVQETRLGYLDGKLVVACRHIHAIDERLQELLALAKVLSDEWFEYFSSGGRLTDIEKVADMMRNEPLLSEINLSDHFWDMFVVDAFIGNTDRHPGNIGIIRGSDGALRCSPVYDNGSSFNAKLQDKKIENIVRQWKTVKNSVALDSNSPYEIDGKRLLPLKYIFTNPNEDCIAAVGRIVPKIDLAACITPVIDLLDSEIISGKRAAFYIGLMSLRYKKRLLPVYKKHFGPLEKDRETFHSQGFSHGRL